MGDTTASGRAQYPYLASASLGRSHPNKPPGGTPGLERLTRGLSEEDRQWVQALQATLPAIQQAIDLARRFTVPIKQRQAAALDAWVWEASRKQDE